MLLTDIKNYDNLQWLEKSQIAQKWLTLPRRWLVTGAAGFIGSHLVEALLRCGQKVIGLDNFSTGSPKNLDDIAACVGGELWENFTFVEGDIRDLATCEMAVGQSEHVLHQAALGSVPRSIVDPLTTNSVNISGFLNLLDAARRANVKTFIYAASSSTYGDEPNLPKTEDRIGNPLSPYGVTKQVNEIYSRVYSTTFGFDAIGLRYFNVFGPRQNPNGAYAAVIPKWIGAMTNDEIVEINGDGTTSRDFCYVSNVVQANILSTIYGNSIGTSVINVAVGESTTLNTLFLLLRTELANLQIIYEREPTFCKSRKGDVLHSLADISRARNLLGYSPTHDIREGLISTLQWHVRENS